MKTKIEPSLKKLQRYLSSKPDLKIDFEGLHSGSLHVNDMPSYMPGYRFDLREEKLPEGLSGHLKGLYFGGLITAVSNVYIGNWRDAKVDDVLLREIVGSVLAEQYNTKFVWEKRSLGLIQTLSHEIASKKAADSFVEIIKAYHETLNSDQIKRAMKNAHSGLERKIRAELRGN